MRFKLIGLALLSMLGACQKPDDFAPHAQHNEMETIRAYIQDNYCPEGAKLSETDEAFVIDGCMMFPKERFWENYSVNPAQEQQEAQIAEDRVHRKYVNKVKDTKTITLCILPSVSKGWHAPIESAAIAWNSLDGEFDFEVIYRTSALPGAVNIDSYIGSATGKVAKATYPTSGGQPGSKIQINSYYDYLGYGYKKFTIVHEIGHTLGFMHTNSSEGTKLVTGISACDNSNDYKSVFRDVLQSFSGFSDCDAYAYWVYYPNW